MREILCLFPGGSRETIEPSLVIVIVLIILKNYICRQSVRPRLLPGIDSYN